MANVKPTRTNNNQCKIRTQIELHRKYYESSSKRIGDIVRLYAMVVRACSPCMYVRNTDLSICIPVQPSHPSIHPSVLESMFHSDEISIGIYVIFSNLQRIRAHLCLSIVVRSLLAGIAQYNIRRMEWSTIYVYDNTGCLLLLLLLLFSFVYFSPFFFLFCRRSLPVSEALTPGPARPVQQQQTHYNTFHSRRRNGNCNDDDDDYK